jgi:hypothetical protein
LARSFPAWQFPLVRHGLQRLLAILLSTAGAITVELEDLWMRYHRLRWALSTACQASCWRSQRIDRLADALAVTERDIAAQEGAATADRRAESIQRSTA